MNNIITATITFCFRGQTFSPSITLKLDDHLNSSGDIPDLHSLIATANNIDFYSYEYEMMLAESVSYSNAEGLITQFITDGKLDLDAFISEWKESRILSGLARIAKDNMNINSLHEHPQLKNALLEAYKAGINKTK